MWPRAHPGTCFKRSREKRTAAPPGSAVPLQGVSSLPDREGAARWIQSRPSGRTPTPRLTRLRRIPPAFPSDTQTRGGSQPTFCLPVKAQFAAHLLPWFMASLVLQEILIFTRSNLPVFFFTASESCASLRKAFAIPGRCFSRRVTPGPKEAFEHPLRKTGG